MTKRSNSTKKPGRPRSEEAKTALLDATTKLMNERPIRTISISQISRESGVGKPTIYRWWDSKCSIVMDAFLAHAGSEFSISPDATGNKALRQYIQKLIQFLNGKSGKTIAEIVGEGQSDPHVIDEFHKRFFTPLLAPAREAIEYGKTTGEFDPAIDTDQAMDFIFGPIYFRLIVGPRILDKAFETFLLGKALGFLAPAPS